MTVSTTTNKVVYIGNGIATSFAIPFPFLEKEHLKVWQLLNDVQTERTDWTVSGGNMVFETAPADGAQIVIMREVPLTQETDYRENEILPAETLERNFDNLTMQVQQLKEKQDRALLLDVFSDDDPNEFVRDVKNAVATAQNAAQEAGNQAQAAAEQADRATAAARTDWVDLDSEQTITGEKAFRNVVTSETEAINFIAKNPYMDITETPEINRYVGYDFRDKNDLRIGYIGVVQSNDGEVRYEIQKPNNYVTKISGITQASATDNSTAMPTTAWVANQRKTGNGIGLPNYGSPTTLSWGTNYTSATAPQVNGWLYFGGTSSNSAYLFLNMNGCQLNAGASGGTAGFYTLFVPYKAKTPFSTSGGSSGQFLKFFPSL